MVSRILLWVVLGIVAWWMLRPRRQGTPPRQAPHAPAAAAAPPEAMVDCAACGLHFPASEALRDGAARVYCCTAHRDAGPRGAR